MKLRIEQDDDPMNPRTEWDNLGTMVCFHKRYILGDKDHGYDPDNYGGWDEMWAAIQEEEDVAAILPLYLYDHGGISIRTGPFSDQWDSGQVGFIFISKDKAAKEFPWWSEKWDHVTDGHPTKILEKHLISEVEVYDQYLTGDVWGYIIEDDDGNHIDSCWGFFGREYCEKEAQDIMESLEKQEKERALELKRVQAAMPCCLP